MNKVKQFALSLSAVILFASIGFGVKFISAQTADESPAPEAVSNEVDQETVTQNLKKRLEGSVDDKVEKVKGLIKDTDSLYSFVGQIKELKDESIALKSQENERHLVFDKDTALVFSTNSNKNKNIEKDEIKPDWHVIAMGRVDENNIMQAQRIIFSEGSPIAQETRRVVFGKVTEVDDKKISLKNHEELSLEFGKKTKLSIVGVKKPDLADITADDKAVIIFEQGEKETVLKAIFIWPGTTSPEAENNQINATGSAEATGSAKKSSE